MASDPSMAEEGCNSDSDEEETVTLSKKRSRRVSFADKITSVHIFKRDDENETPPASFSNNESHSVSRPQVLDFSMNPADVDDSKKFTADGGDVDLVEAAGKSFLRLVGSPSPRGIIPSSAAAADNRDFTLDSDSLAWSVSGADLQTPSSQFVSHIEPGSSAISCVDWKLNSQKPYLYKKLSGGRSSSAMSIVGENTHLFDFARLSPTLDALLAEGSNDLHRFSLSNSATSKSSLAKSSMLCDGKKSPQSQGDVGDVTSHVDQSSLDCFMDVKEEDLDVSVGCAMVPPSIRMSKVQSLSQISKMSTPTQINNVHADHGEATGGISTSRTDLHSHSHRSHPDKAGDLQNFCKQLESVQHVDTGEGSPVKRVIKEMIVVPISSLSAKRQKILVPVSGSALQLADATPARQSSSVSSKASVKDQHAVDAIADVELHPRSAGYGTPKIASGMPNDAAEHPVSSAAAEKLRSWFARRLQPSPALSVDNYLETPCLQQLSGCSAMSQTPLKIENLSNFHSALAADRNDLIATTPLLPKGQIPDEVSKSPSYLPLHSGGSINLPKAVNPESTFQKFLHVLEEKQFLSPSVNMLNLAMIDALQDILVFKQKAMLRDMLLTHIHSRKTHNPSICARNKRIAEVNQLFCKLVHGKARLQLGLVKHEKMLKRAERMRLAVQECQKLKPNPLSSQTMPWMREAAPAYKIQNDSMNDKVSSKITEMRHEYETLQQKLKNFTDSIPGLNKDLDDQSCSNSIAVLSDKLQKRLCCRHIHEDLQLWKIDDLSIADNQYVITINYCDLILQKITMNLDVTPRICVSNQLNDTHITKSFPNMDANTGFGFVLNSVCFKNSFESKSLMQQTQVVTFLLHNLLEIVKEVQLAKMEIKSLVEAKFHVPSVNQLELRLNFVNCKSRSNVILTVDVTCLKCGMYPSEATSYQICNGGRSGLLSSSRMNEIKAAIDRIENGDFRIIRICSCVSRVMESF